MNGVKISDHQQRLAPSRAFFMPLSLLVVADFRLDFTYQQINVRR
jgi:hypothetical protein